jgi:hypothetical protein
MTKPREKINPRELMEKALRLIAEELVELKQASAMGKLDPDNTTALIRYSDALLKYVKDGIGQEEEEKKTVAKMSNEELIEAAKKLTEKNKKSDVI